MLDMLNDGTINVATILIGALSTTIRPTRRFFRRRCNSEFRENCWNSQKTITDFLNGATAIPFACLAIAAIYPAMAEVVLNNKNTMALAGVIGLIFVVGEICTAGRDD